MTTVELTISYFAGSSQSPVSYIVEEDFATYEEAIDAAPLMVNREMECAYEDEAMMDTFYFSYDFLMDAEAA